MALHKRSAMAQTIKSSCAQVVFQACETFVAEQNSWAAFPIAAVQHGEDADSLTVRTVLLAHFIEDQQIHAGKAADYLSFRGSLLSAPGLPDPVNKLPNGGLQNRPALSQQVPGNRCSQVVFSGTGITQQNQPATIGVLREGLGKVSAGLQGKFLAVLTHVVVAKVALLVTLGDGCTGEQGFQSPLDATFWTPRWHDVAYSALRIESRGRISAMLRTVLVLWVPLGQAVQVFSRFQQTVSLQQGLRQGSNRRPCGFPLCAHSDTTTSVEVTAAFGDVWRERAQRVRKCSACLSNMPTEWPSRRYKPCSWSR